MEKRTLLSAFLLVFCLLAGCDNTKQEVVVEPTVEPIVEPVAEMKNSGEDVVSSDIVELYKKEGQITCVATYEDDELWSVTSKMYVDGENLYQEVDILESGVLMKLYALILDGQNYSRWDLYGEGIWYVVALESTMEEELANFDTDSQEENVSINCEAWVEWVTFEVPADIEFVDLLWFEE